jgi:signal transduction histidine kinase
MTAFSQYSGLEEATPERSTPAPKRPPRWSLSNWPVRWKVLAIVLVPLLVAGIFGALRIDSSVRDASDLRLAAHRADLIPDITDYMAALENAVVAATAGGETQQALEQFNARKSALGGRLGSTDVIPDVRLAVTTLLNYGQNLVDSVMSNSIDLRQRVQTYAPLLLTAETAITASTTTADPQIKLQAEGLARAVGARGQMALQKMLVERGADLPEPVLRSSMSAVAGTEPSTVAGMAELLGGASQEAGSLRSETFKRLALIADPAVPLVNNPDLLASEQITTDIADKVIADTTTAIPAAVDRNADAARTAAIRDSALVAAAIVVALLLVLLVARSLIRPLRTLRDSALKVAHEDLAHELDRVRAGEEPGVVTPIPVYTTEEVGQVAHAVDELHQQAVLLAGEQSQLQTQVSDMFETLSRRSRSLVDQQLTLIDRLERNEEDPERLDSLFKLDHLAARMRRNGANLLVLAGARIPRDQAQPVAVGAVINAAASEVEEYARVVTAAVPDTEIAGPVAGDLVHLLAEILDNALRYSPPTTQVQVSSAHTGDGGLTIEVSDSGLGMTESDLRVANARLQSGGEVDPYTARHMGLFVVGRLATQHGVTVRLRSTLPDDPASGTTAEVRVPADVVAQPWASTPPPHSEYAATYPQHDQGAFAEPAASVNGHADAGSLLPQRDPGASGISAGLGAAAFFSSRPPHDEDDALSAPLPVADAAATAGAEDAIYQSMLSEWLIDPTQIARSSDLNWQSVWDHGWSAAEAAEEAPVDARTEEGLPMRQPGARLVPGGVEEAAEAGRNGRHRNGGAHRSDAAAGEVASRRDPDAVRASMASHFGGVHAGRSHAREARGNEYE